MENILTCLQERGFVDQLTSEEIEKLVSKPMKLYVGFDPTADSLHIGHLVGIVALAWFQKYGHIPFALIGGATGRIGDPSGKSIERPFLEDKMIGENAQSIGDFLEKLLQDFPGEKPVILNNNDWIKKFSYIDFLRDIGKYFRLGSMMAKESVKARLSSPEGMSYTEFSYQILQAYDFFYLSQHHGINLQIGGSDQWGNITAGIELARKLGNVSLYGMTFPLLTRSDGKKFGKTEEGAIWLSEKRLSPYKFYQYFMTIPDSDVIKLMRLLTFMDMQEIRKYEQMMEKPDYVPNTAQKKLAEELTLFVHKKEGLATALKATETAFGKEKLSADMLKEIEEDLPHVDLSKNKILGQKYTDIAAEIGLVTSKSEATRLVKNKGAYLNNEKMEDISYLIDEKDLIDKKYLLFGKGKKKKILICLV